MKCKGMMWKTLTALVLVLLFVLTGTQAVKADNCSPGSKKGIQTGNGYELVSYDGSNAFFNLDVSTLVTSSVIDGYELYKYNGTQYYLNWYRLYNLQSSCQTLKNYNVQSITIGLLPYHPTPGITVDSALANANIYGFLPNNTTRTNCIKILAGKIAEYLGEYVDFWHIGNEIDNYVVWNAVSGPSGVTIDNYAKYYSDTMRIFNDAMKKKNSNCAIVIPFDQGWNHVDAHHFSTKTLLTKIAANIKSGGDFNWGLCLHPYPTPLTDAVWWDDAAAGCTKADSADMVTFYNLEVITNYMNTSAMKYNNSVRPIVVTEWGINAYKNGKEDQTLQAASFARAYYKAAGNPYIQSVVYNATTDAWGGNATYKFGISGREIENVFRHIDKDDGYKYTKKYLSYFGVSNWESLLTLTELGFSSTYTGCVTVGDHAAYFTSGKVDTSKNGLYKSASDGREFYLQSGRSSVDYTTVVKNSSGKMYYVSHGMKIPDFTGLEKCLADEKYYFLENGSESTYTGVVERPSNGSWYYVKNGVYDKSFTGFAEKYGETWRKAYVVGGKWQSDFNGVVTIGGKDYVVNEGYLDEYFTGLAHGDRWYFFENGVRNTTFTGLVERPDNGAWYYVENGVYKGSFSGIAAIYGYSWRKGYVVNGRWQDAFTGIGNVDGTRYIIEYGYLDEYFTGLKHDDRWYFFVKGVQNKEYTGVVERPDTGDWYYVTNGVYDNSFTGFAEKYNDSWNLVYVKNGKWQNNFTGNIRDPESGIWYYVSSGYQYYEIDPILNLSVENFVLIEGMTETVTENGVTWEKYPECTDVSVETILGTYSGSLASVNTKLNKNIGANYQITIDSDQSPTDPWGVGTHIVTLRAGSTSRSIRIYILSASQASQELYMDRDSVTIAAGKTQQINVVRTYDGYAVAGLSWASSNENVATVSTGKVKGIGVGSATITASAPKTGHVFSCEVTVLFKDVADETKYFFEPVYWALGRGITTGTTAATFSPNNNCTREQFVTFLWRYFGSPEPTEIRNFKDVKAGAYYEKAVSWAAERGITTGVSATEFGVGQTCSRAMCITFLWRAAGEPTDGIEGAEGFTDVPEGKYFTNAVLWGSSHNITTGLNDGSGRFGVNEPCTRAMTVTFLYRYDGVVN